ncbi:MAG: hypothetical protein OEZ06_25650 [Myxococcales bacterium]|nr:hypothetical protein [Myxococcales bacterium]
MLGKPAVDLFKATGLSLLLLACGSDASVPSAGCQRCGAAITEELCLMVGEESGCEKSRLVPAAPGECDGCSFTNCDEPPSCNVSPGLVQDSGPPPAPDPACATADADGDGLFSEPPPGCSDPGMVNINGAISYTCPCGGTCPCGYQCGSIPLSVGGTLGSVCAPPQ